ncbi:MAG: glycosyltransferase family 4 protein [Dehalococcoidia bacterium]
MKNSLRGARRRALQIVGSGRARGDSQFDRGEIVVLVDRSSPASLEHWSVLEAALAGTWNARNIELPALGLEWTDPVKVQELLSELRKADWVVFVGLEPMQLDALFRLRLAQILSDSGPMQARSAVLLVEPQEGDLLPKGFVERASSSWPFVGLDLVSAGPLSDRVQAEIGVPIPFGGAEEIARLIKSQSSARIKSSARPDQILAMVVQPLGGRCGSTTAFENETEELVISGCFVLRIYINEAETAGATVYRHWPRIVRENSVNAGAHANAMALAPNLPPEDPVSERSGYDHFVHSIIGRFRCNILDEAVATGARRARVVIMNHVITTGFVLRLCPEATILLDTHDYITRWAFAHARGSAAGGIFESRAPLLRMARLEADLWRIPDVCTSVSIEESRRVARHNVHSALVLPRPYVFEVPVTEEAVFAWDALITGDNHEFNVASVRWFIDTVLASEPALKRLRIAIVGRVAQQFDVRSLEATTNLRFLGFVDDLESLRASCRLTLVPDQAGTGISVKALTALAAAHPLVSTAAGLRGFDSSVRLFIPGHKEPREFAADLIRLVEDSPLLAVRRDASKAAYHALLGNGSYRRCLQETNPPDAARLQLRSQTLARIAKLARDLPSEAANGSSGTDRAFDFRAGGNGSTLLSTGWHKGEVWGRWMDGEISVLKLPISAGGYTADSIEIMAWTVMESVSLEVFLDGLSLGRQVVGSATTRLSYAVPKSHRWTSEARTIRLQASAARALSDTAGLGDTRVLGPGIIRLWLEPLQIHQCDTVFDVASEAADYVLKQGWHGREEWGRWMHGREAFIEFQIDSPAHARCILVLDHAPCSAGGSIDVLVNGIDLGRRVVVDGLSRWELPSKALKPGRPIRLTLRSSSVWRPSDHTQSTDTRLLGVGLRRFWVEVANYSSVALLPPSKRKREQFVRAGRRIGSTLFGRRSPME